MPMYPILPILEDNMLEVNLISTTFVNIIWWFVNEESTEIGETTSIFRIVNNQLAVIIREQTNTSNKMYNTKIQI
jgi:hypothetical protein